MKFAFSSWFVFLSAKLPHALTDDRLVNVSNNNLRSYVTVHRPTAPLSGGDQQSLAAGQTPTFLCNFLFISLKFLQFCLWVKGTICCCLFNILIFSYLLAHFFILYCLLSVCPVVLAGDVRDCECCLLLGDTAVLTPPSSVTPRPPLAVSPADRDIPPSLNPATPLPPIAGDQAVASIPCDPEGQ